jgi:hypothetical protein
MDNKRIMKITRRMLVSAGAAVLLSVAGGCSTPLPQISYLTPGNDVFLDSKPVVNVVATGDETMMTPLVTAVRSEFAKSNQFVVSEESPDYLIVMNGEEQYRKDKDSEIIYNRKVEKSSVENDSSGNEVIVASDKDSSAFSGVLNVAVYSVKDLSPVCYFDIPLYDSDFKTKGDAVRGAGDYEKTLQAQMVEKMKDAFVSQKRAVPTIFPKRGDDRLKSLLENGKAQEAIERGKVVLPLEFEAFMENAINGKYAKWTDFFCSNSEIEENLSNYYLVSIAEEMEDYSTETLEKLHARHCAILNQTEDSKLKEACPNALARIEYKLKRNQASGR